jgi:hypothetical protein
VRWPADAVRCCDVLERCAWLRALLPKLCGLFGHEAAQVNRPPLATGLLQLGRAQPRGKGSVHLGDESVGQHRPVYATVAAEPVGRGQSQRSIRPAFLPCGHNRQAIEALGGCAGVMHSQGCCEGTEERVSGCAVVTVADPSEPERVQRSQGAFAVSVLFIETQTFLRMSDGGVELPVGDLATGTLNKGRGHHMLIPAASSRRLGLVKPLSQVGVRVI